jgi:hypothetical protein
MFFRNTTLSLFMVIIIALSTFSCGDDNPTNVSPSSNICSADITGDTTFTFSSKSATITNSTTESEYVILQSTIITGNNEITYILIRFKDTGVYTVPFDLTKDDNFAQVSINTNKAVYNKIEGTLNISEKVGKRVKATFSFKAVKQDPTKNVIEVKNGVFDFSL